MATPGKLRVWGLCVAAAVNILLDSYLLMRLYSDLEQAAPENRTYLTVAVLALVGIGLMAFIPFVFPRRFLPQSDLAIPFAIGISALWLPVGLTLSGMLGI